MSIAAGREAGECIAHCTHIVDGPSKDGKRSKRSVMARCAACVDKTLAFSVAVAAVASTIFTVVQLVAMVFNIVIIRQGLAYFDAFIPEIQLVSRALVFETRANTPPPAADRQFIA